MLATNSILGGILQLVDIHSFVCWTNNLILYYNEMKDRFAGAILCLNTKK